ncbi:MAG: hypothetical protein HWN65_15260 [Candidatus Helarchaeota archaeon]|nr:hypothetical protein [Candidatus Helarchaeota archaeon]
MQESWIEMDFFMNASVNHFSPLMVPYSHHHCHERMLLGMHLFCRAGTAVKSRLLGTTGGL